MLLGLLGTLAGAFAGVLSMKLFVPRPPAGTGPDVHVAATAAEPLDLVDPPELTAPPQAPPSKPDPFLALGLPPAADAGLDAGVPAADVRGSRFASADDLPAAEPAPPSAAGDAWQRDGSTPTEPPAFAGPPQALPAVLLEDADALAAAPGRVVPTAAMGPAAVEPIHVVRAGDSWWGIAEAAYGDGRYYKALFAWNRSLDPRTSLAPGTRLDVPDEAQLRAAWARLVPDGAGR
jgi:5'-nucleotidase